MSAQRALRLLKLSHREIGDSDEPHLAGIHQFTHGAHRLVNRDRRIWLVKLQKVYRLYAQPKKAPVDRLSQVRRTEILRGHLGGNEYAIPQLLDRFTNHILRAIRFRRIEKERSALQAAAQGLRARMVIPSADSDLGNGNAGPAEFLENQIGSIAPLISSARKHEKTVSAK
jgi:hypothetical protein